MVFPRKHTFQKIDIFHPKRDLGAFLSPFLSLGGASGSLLAPNWMSLAALGAPGRALGMPPRPAGTPPGTTTTTTTSTTTTTTTTAPSSLLLRTPNFFTENRNGHETDLFKSKRQINDMSLHKKRGEFS